MSNVPTLRTGIRAPDHGKLHGANPAQSSQFEGCSGRMFPALHQPVAISFRRIMEPRLEALPTFDEPIVLISPCKTLNTT